MKMKARVARLKARIKQYEENMKNNRLSDKFKRGLSKPGSLNK